MHTSQEPRHTEVAATANASRYDASGVTRYRDGAPHIKHRKLNLFYVRLLTEVFDAASKVHATPRVLDLGAGEGTATIPLLTLGARVTAIDISAAQLSTLRKKCESFGDRLAVRCEDIETALDTLSGFYDVIVANSFLHHVPDYLSLIRRSTRLLAEGGHFFCFQDPLRYSSMSIFDRVFSDVAYVSWRITRGDALGGVCRRLRRMRGVYLESSAQDNAEYHVVRGGVDQHAICSLLQELDFEVRLYPYFSTQSTLFQPIGHLLGVRNTFAVTASKRVSTSTPRTNISFAV
jgi:2-polyprenyl-3-methyl-5-hydroxy-6-metoxy-1,4-benzoquinol methylase